MAEQDGTNILKITYREENLLEKILNSSSTRNISPPSNPYETPPFDLNVDDSLLDVYPFGRDIDSYASYFKRAVPVNPEVVYRLAFKEAKEAYTRVLVESLLNGEIKVNEYFELSGRFPVSLKD